MACGGATIVVVERSAGAMELIDQAFRDTPDRVLITQSPLEVLDVAARIRIDLLVSYFADLDLGANLVAELRLIQPDLRVLYILSRTEPQASSLGSDSVLRNPFSLDELREAVDASLDRSFETAR